MKQGKATHWLVLCMGLLSLSARLSGQLPTNCFPIWQGFSQQWGYPHAIDRLGDWVVSSPENEDCALQASHAAAAGKAVDRADFTQYYAQVQSGLVTVQEGSLTFSLSGKEGEYVAEVQIADADFFHLEDPEMQYTVVLNGFDLIATEGVQADKIQAIDMEIDSVWRDAAAGKLRFRMRSAIKFACSSGECEPLNQVVDYQLKLYWLAIGGQGFRAQSSTFGSGRSWEKQDTAVMPPMPRVALLGDAHYPQATAAIRGLHLQLDHDQHMLVWESYLQAERYDQGLLMAHVGMAFVQNNPFMRAAYKQRHQGFSVHPPRARAGSLAWEMDVVLLQFEDATIQAHSRLGKIEWKGKQAETASSLSVE